MMSLAPFPSTLSIASVKRSGGIPFFAFASSVSLSLSLSLSLKGSRIYLPLSCEQDADHANYYVPGESTPHPIPAPHSLPSQNVTNLDHLLYRKGEEPQSSFKMMVETYKVQLSSSPALDTTLHPRTGPHESEIRSSQTSSPPPPWPHHSPSGHWKRSLSSLCLTYPPPLSLSLRYEERVSGSQDAFSSLRSLRDEHEILLDDQHLPHHGVRPLA
jgi:hypothetical protein